MYESFLLTYWSSSPPRVTISTLPNFPLHSPECDIKSKMVTTIQTTTKTNTKTKHSITAFRSPQNKPALKIKVTNIISSKNYLSLQLSRSVLHVSMYSRWRGELMFLRGLESPETLLNFTSPLHCPSPPPHTPPPPPTSPPSIC